MADRDPFDTPGWRAYEQRVKDELVPMIRDSSITVSIIPANREPDVKLAVELGFSILLGKPIVLAVIPGAPIPDALARIAEEIVEFDVARDPDGTQQRLMAALGRVGVGPEAAR